MATMNARTLFFSLLVVQIVASPVRADPIPSDRRTTWMGNVGVPGGIPNRTTIFANIDPALGNGTTNSQPAIGGAINSCPANQVVKLPDGVFLLNTNLRPSPNNKSNYTIRGNGPGRTILKVANGTGAIALGALDWPPRTTENQQQITGGATAGSATFTVASSAAFTVGDMAHVAGTPMSYTTGAWDQYGEPARPICMNALVTAKDATHVTLDHVLPFTITSTAYIVPYPTTPVKGVGLEDLTIDANGNNHAGSLEQASGCWLKNVEIKNCSKQAFVFIAMVNSEIRHCTFRDEVYLPEPGNPFGTGRNHEGLDFEVRCSWNLVEDSIFNNGGFCPISIGDFGGSAVGNAITFNYFGTINTATTASGGAVNFHGGHCMFTLIEGNVAMTGSMADGYYGSVSHTTYLRNWFGILNYSVGNPPGFGDPHVHSVSQNKYGIRLDRCTNYTNAVGNIFGDPNLGSGGGGSSVAYETSELNGFPGGNSYIFVFGYPYLGATDYSSTFGPQTPPQITGSFPPNQTIGEPLDRNVKNTAFITGNYDYKTNSQVWDSADHAIADSYIYSSKPAWFGSAINWPPINPASRPGVFDNAHVATVNNAAYRFVNGVDPTTGTPCPTPTVPPVITSQPASVAVDPGVAPSFSASISCATGGVTYRWLKDGVNVGPAPVSTTNTTNTYLAPAAVSGDNGARFKVDIVNASGTTHSNEATLTVNPTPTPTPTPTPVPYPTWHSDIGAIDAPFVADHSGHTIQQPTLTVDPATGGRAYYTISIPSPTPASGYTLSMNVSCPDPGSNSIYAQFDAEPTNPANFVEFAPTSGFENRDVMWVPETTAHVFNLTAGSHFLIVRGREGETVLGDMTLTPNSGATPTPTPTPTAAPSPTASPPNFTPNGGETTDPGSFSVTMDIGPSLAMSVTPTPTPPTYKWAESNQLTFQTYTTPIPVTHNMVIRGYTQEPGKIDSPVVTSNQFSIKVATPVITPPSGIYANNQTVTITTTTTPATISYMLNGGPLLVYGTPFEVNAELNTITAHADQIGKTQSDPQTVKISITSPTPTATPTATQTPTPTATPTVPPLTGGGWFR